MAQITPKLSKFRGLTMAVALTTLVGGCGTANEQELVVDTNSSELGTTAEWFGLNQFAYVTYKGTTPIVNEFTAKLIPSNKTGKFWWFCGQGATLTAFNWAMGKAPDEATKKVQLEWIHSKLFTYQGSDYNATTPPDGNGGPYAASFTALMNLMVGEKGEEVTTTNLSVLSSSHKEDSVRREKFVNNITTALKNGAYVVALNRLDSNSGPGHYLAVYFIDYQPSKTGRGTVYFGDTYNPENNSAGKPVPNGRFGTVTLDDFLLRTKSQSKSGHYQAFSIKKK